jgi:hypothetical protein
MMSRSSFLLCADNVFRERLERLSDPVMSHDWIDVDGSVCGR